MTSSRTVRRPVRRLSGAPSLGPLVTVPAAALDGLTLPADGGGVKVVLGCDERDVAVQITLVRSAPTRLVVVGGSYLARQLVLRASATGIAVVVVTGRPAVWDAVVRATERASGHGVRLVRDWQPGSFPAPSSVDPVLVVLDGSAVPHHVVPSSIAWQTTAVLLPFLHPEVGRIATDADLVLVRRLPPDQAELASRLWNLDDQRAGWLTDVPDDAVVALRSDHWQPTRLVTSPIESSLLGPMRAGG